MSAPPVLVFLGVSTGQSAVHSLFHEWTSCLGTPLTLQGQDLPLDSPREAYRRLVADWRADAPRVLGVLVTSHKAALFDAAADLFDSITPETRRLQEIGMVYRRPEGFVADGGDTDSNRQAAHRLLAGSDKWRRGAKAAVVLGGGGAGVALAHTLATAPELECSRITITEISARRVDAIQRLVKDWRLPVPISVELVARDADHLVGSSRPGTLIANATGLGKDRPGSPVTSAVMFPPESFIWDFNYRFVPQDSPTFLQTASAQAGERDLTIEDGWNYFIWGWLVVMSRVVGLEADGFYNCFDRAAGRFRASAGFRETSP
jgi:shikimate dehydrogenase